MTTPEPTAAQRERVQKLVADWFGWWNHEGCVNKITNLLAAETAPLLAALEQLSNSVEHDYASGIFTTTTMNAVRETRAVIKHAKEG